MKFEGIIAKSEANFVRGALLHATSNLLMRKISANQFIIQTKNAPTFSRSLTRELQEDYK